MEKKKTDCKAVTDVKIKILVRLKRRWKGALSFASNANADQSAFS